MNPRRKSVSATTLRAFFIAVFSVASICLILSLCPRKTADKYEPPTDSQCFAFVVSLIVCSISGICAEKYDRIDVSLHTCRIISDTFSGKFVRMRRGRRIVESTSRYRRDLDYLEVDIAVEVEGREYIFPIPIEKLNDLEIRAKIRQGVKDIQAEGEIRQKMRLKLDKTNRVIDYELL